MVSTTFAGTGPIERYVYRYFVMVNSNSYPINESCCRHPDPGGRLPTSINSASWTFQTNPTQKSAAAGIVSTIVQPGTTYDNPWGVVSNVTTPSDIGNTPPGGRREAVAVRSRTTCEDTAPCPLNRTHHDSSNRVGYYSACIRWVVLHTIYENNIKCVEIKLSIARCYRPYY